MTRIHDALDEADGGFEHHFPPPGWSMSQRVALTALAFLAAMLGLYLGDLIG